MKNLSDVPPYQIRVIEEKAQLDEKIEKLTAFFVSETYAMLSSIDRALLMEQQGLMMEYSNKLLERIVRFGGTLSVGMASYAVRTEAQAQFANAMAQLTLAKDGRDQRVRLMPYGKEPTADTLRETTREFVATFIGEEGSLFISLDGDKIVESKPAEIAAWTNLALLANATAAAIKADR